jgi:large subunit ribosomal protein L30
MTKARKYKLTLVKSKHGRRPEHVASLLGLGLRRMHQTVVVDATPENLGMIAKVSYMLRVEGL